MGHPGADLERHQQRRHAARGRIAAVAQLAAIGGDDALGIAFQRVRSQVVVGAGQAIVKMVTADMAQKLGVAQDSITVLAAEAMNWRTSGLGCEQPDQMYLQVITPGYQVVLTDGSNVYTYHTDARGRFVLCQQAVR